MDRKMSKEEEVRTPCMECKAMVGTNEFHTYSHCLIAKAYPDRWRDIIKDVNRRVQSDEGQKEHVWLKCCGIVQRQMDSLKAAIKHVGPDRMDLVNELSAGAINLGNCLSEMKRLDIAKFAAPPARELDEEKLRGIIILYFVDEYDGVPLESKIIKHYDNGELFK